MCVWIPGPWFWRMKYSSSEQNYFTQVAVELDAKRLAMLKTLVHVVFEDPS